MIDTASVLKLERTRYQAMVSNDVVLLERLLSDRLVYTHSSGRRDSKDSYLAALRNHTVTYRGINQSVDGVERVHGVVIISGSVEGSVISRNTSRRLSLVTTSVWADDGGSWRLVAFHSTPSAGSQ